MENINIGIVREKKEDLRVEIQILESEIKSLKESGDKYRQVPDKQRYLDTLKQKWNELNTTLGKEYNSIVRESVQAAKEEKKASKEVTYNDVSINEEWAINNHYRQMHELHKNIIKIDRQINKEEDFVKKTKLQGKKSSLEKELEILKSYSKSDIIMFAKTRKAAYLNAKQRYRKLSAMEKLKIKMSGKEITWDKIKDDLSYTTSDLEVMYQGRSK